MIRVLSISFGEYTKVTYMKHIFKYKDYYASGDFLLE